LVRILLAEYEKRENANNAQDMAEIRRSLEAIKTKLDQLS